ncbi:penicillin-binding protein, partial [Nonomuraea sp. K274]|nr:penicillin-binding protein [Nonomuraea cypriaca]
AVDFAPLTGTYRREGVAVHVSERAGTPHLVYELLGDMKDMSPPIEADLVPVSKTVFAARGDGPLSGEWMPVVFSTLADGTGCVYFGMRVTPKVTSS